MTATSRDVTIREVAAVAGVSPATVSRVLSGSRRVGPELEAAVRTASEQLGYRVDPIARALRRRSTQAVGMVVPDITNPFFPGIVQAVERSLYDTDNGLLLGDSADDPAVEADRLATLLDRRVDGLVVVACHSRRSAPAIAAAAARVPVVLLDREVDGVRTDHVGIDDAAGIAAATEHLVAAGRRRPAFVGAETEISTAGRRSGAFRATLDRLLPGLPPTVLEGSFSARWGVAAVERLFGPGAVHPDAVVCANDLIALGVLRGLRDRGIAVPDDVAVTGFDDIGFATIADPPLSTARQPLDELGAACVRLLLERIAGDRGATRGVRLAPQFVVRASTGDVTTKEGAP